MKHLNKMQMFAHLVVTLEQKHVRLKNMTQKWGFVKEDTSRLAGSEIWCGATSTSHIPKKREIIFQANTLHPFLKHSITFWLAVTLTSSLPFPERLAHHVHVCVVSHIIPATQFLYGMEKKGCTDRKLCSFPWLLFSTFLYQTSKKKTCNQKLYVVPSG